MHASQPQPSRSALGDQYASVRATSLELTQPFTAEDHMLQSMPDASPLKWHLAHTTWFFETFILSERVSGYKPFDSRFKTLFNSYYKQLGAHPYRGSRGLMSRPTLAEVHAYRQWVDEKMLEYLSGATEEADGLIELGLNHEQQHQELMITDIKHAMWSMPLRSARVRVPKAVASVAPLSFRAVAGGVYEIGHSGETFAFDNECPRHEVLLREFEIANRQVTNAEYLEFVLEGGYRQPELWLSDGWDTVCAQGWQSPLYWEQQDGSWLEFTLEGLKEVDLAAPVCHISYYEADAFARWSGARLPKEEEWEVAAVQASDARSGPFLEDRTLFPAPAPPDAPQWFGNVWEWTASPYVGYPGFSAAPGVVGEYNGKFMCNQFVLRGGSCATPRSHVRATYRNFFPPHARWQFMGIRLAK